ncbi:MAG: tetratricopeptide repeat protein [Candidatus Melainabacteria bacterium]|nr:tetratricopeptide repeat protein [Candidatus Melainabacteria bacterium]
MQEFISWTAVHEVRLAGKTYSYSVLKPIYIKCFLSSAILLGASAPALAQMAGVKPQSMPPTSKSKTREQSGRAETFGAGSKPAATTKPGTAKKTSPAVESVEPGQAEPVQAVDSAKQIPAENQTTPPTTDRDDDVRDESVSGSEPPQGSKPGSKTGVNANTKNAASSKDTTPSTTAAQAGSGKSTSPAGSSKTTSKATAKNAATAKGAAKTTGQPGSGTQPSDASVPETSAQPNTANDKQIEGIERTAPPAGSGTAAQASSTAPPQNGSATPPQAATTQPPQQAGYPPQAPTKLPAIPQIQRSPYGTQPYPPQYQQPGYPAQYPYAQQQYRPPQAYPGQPYGQSYPGQPYAGQPYSPYQGGPPAYQPPPAQAYPPGTAEPFSTLKRQYPAQTPPQTYPGYPMQQQGYPGQQPGYPAQQAYPQQWQQQPRQYYPNQQYPGQQPGQPGQPFYNPSAQAPPGDPARQMPAQPAQSLPPAQSQPQQQPQQQQQQQAQQTPPSETTQTGQQNGQQPAQLTPNTPPAQPAAQNATPPQSASMPGYSAPSGDNMTEFLAKVAAGRQMISSGNPAFAVESLDKAVKLRPRNLSVYFYRGLAYDESGDPSKAVNNYMESLERAKTVGMDSAELRTNLGNSYMKLNFFNDAIVEYQKAIDIEPASGAAHMQLGRAYLTKGDYQSALKSLRRCDTLGYNDASLPYLKALSLAALKQKQEAIAELAPLLTADAASRVPQLNKLAEDLKNELK